MASPILWHCLCTKVLIYPYLPACTSHKKCSTSLAISACQQQIMEKEPKIEIFIRNQPTTSNQFFFCKGIGYFAKRALVMNGLRCDETENR